VKICEKKATAIEVLAELSTSSEISSHLVASLDALPLVQILVDHWYAIIIIILFSEIILTRYYCNSSDLLQIEEVSESEKKTTSNLIQIFTNCIESDHVSKNRAIEDTMREELINYMITLGLFDHLRNHFHVYTQFSTISINLIEAFNLLKCILFHFTRCGKLIPVYQKKEISNTNCIVKSIEETTILGILPLMTSLILSNNRPTNNRELNEDEVNIILTSFQILNSIACLNLTYLQETLGDSFQSELFHIVSYVLTYCTSSNIESINNQSESAVKAELTKQNLLNELVLLVGFFALEHEKNQEILQFNNGRCATLLQRLCSLPIQYFTDPELKSVLLPTLICICFNNELNKEILEQELSTQLITVFMQQEQEKQSLTTEPTSTTRMTEIFDFGFRFPRNKIKEAIVFFKQSTV
jgi:hypothetical protein